MLRKSMITPGIFAPMLSLGRLARPFLPTRLRDKVPPAEKPAARPAGHHQRKVIIAQGCVQNAYKPATIASLSRVLDRIGIESIPVPAERCCGALSHHLDAFEEARRLMRANIDAWWPHIEAGAEAILSSASGCGVMIKDYGDALKEDPAYGTKARRVAEMCRDAVEFLELETLEPVEDGQRRRVAFQSPCTLQHGQKLGGRVEALLAAVGHTLVPVEDAHLCCGSAGAYALFQQSISGVLRERKLANLTAGRPEVIATANIGCQLHLESGTGIPVRHWIELLDRED